MSLSLKPEFISKTVKTRLYQLDLPIIGLTGGIATGKSTVAELLKTSGLQVLSADQLVKNIYGTTEAKEFIQTHFPQVIENNFIVFKKLREIVFSDPLAKKEVEDFIYSKLPQTFLNAKNELVKNHPQMKCLIYDVPLLFEKGLFLKVDLSICVYLTRNEQKERLMKRDQIGAELAERILNEQWDIEVKKSKADTVIENTGTLKDLEIAVNQFVTKHFI